MPAAKQPLIVYASDQSHSSVGKAALLAGFGRDNVRMVAHDDAYAMLPERLDAAIDKDKADGKQPCAIVATTGTTTTTAIDPVQAIARVARSHGLWFHVDAAMAGSAMILPECRWMWEGVEGADSLVLNAHKWLGAAFDCSVYYVRDPEHLVRVMSTNPSYLQSAADGRVKNLRDWGIPLGRRFRALKLWCLLRAEGVTALQGAFAGTSRTPAGWLARCARQRPRACWPRCRCKPSASGTSRPGWKETTWTNIRWAGPIASIARVARPDPGNPGRSLDGPGLGRCRARRTPSRRVAPGT